MQEEKERKQEEQQLSAIIELPEGEKEALFWKN